MTKKNLLKKKVPFHLSTELFTTQSRLLTTLRKEAFENILGKGENAGHQHFLLFPKCFPSSQKQISIFKSHLVCPLQKLSVWNRLRFVVWERVKSIYCHCQSHGKKKIHCCSSQHNFSFCSPSLITKLGHIKRSIFF